jgi:hypothetical protein
VDKDDHLMECMYRLLLENLVFVDYGGAQRSPIEYPAITSPPIELEENVWIM